MSNESIDKKVVFIQYDIPPLKVGEYTVELTQKVKANQQNDSFSTTRKFAVSGERFSIDPQDINSVFPQNLANGEFSGVLPHVIFNRRILPWERTSVIEDQDAAWLSAFLFNDNELPAVQKKTAKDLVPSGENISVWGSTLKGVGTMPAGYLSIFNNLQASRSRINATEVKLDYGESPDDPCNVIDIRADVFNAIAPSKKDLTYLSHIRETDTFDKQDPLVTETKESYAVVIGNRLPLNDHTSSVFLVSLENLGPYLPNDDGSSNLPSDINYVRLITYLSWSFTVNEDDAAFDALLENLNKDSSGNLGLTSLQVPFKGTPPTQAQVQASLLKLNNNTLDPADATVLAESAFMMGYTPHNHYLRHAGNTVSWYRGPLSPYPVKENFIVPVSCPDAANRYDPDAGLFDVSYGAAWQLGQLLALQNQSFAASLYNWKKSQYAADVIAAEQKILEEKYKNLTAFGHLFAKRKINLESAADIPDDIVKWMGQLSVLNGVPFNYLVPDERMLPIESMRFFFLDNNWIDALLDGAFSIGRSTTSETTGDAIHFQKVRARAKIHASKLRKRKPSLEKYVNSDSVVTGFLLRSAVLRGWPGLEINAYSDKEGKNEITKLRMARISDEVMICLFDGNPEMVAIHEPPEALHSGVEGSAPNFSTTLRVVRGTGLNPGEQIIGHSATIPVRDQTIKVKDAADSILNTLNTPPLNEGITSFTAAEFALEMIKGVVKVEFVKDDSGFFVRK